jgi:hypothetical protein
VIEINYTLHCDNGDICYEERASEHVPRVGDMLAFNPMGASYQVIDVLWHFPPGHPASVTITAGELSWHKYIGDAATAWRDRIANPGEDAA